MVAKIVAMHVGSIVSMLYSCPFKAKWRIGFIFLPFCCFPCESKVNRTESNVIVAATSGSRKNSPSSVNFTTVTLL